MKSKPHLDTPGFWWNVPLQLVIEVRTPEPRTEPGPWVFLGEQSTLLPDENYPLKLQS